MAVTLQTIADRVGISRSAVSQILNRRSNDFSSQETREKVFTATRELGYRQKFGHKLLRGDKTGTICILLASEAQSREEHIRELTLQLLRETAKLGRSCYLESCREDSDNVKMVQSLIERGTDVFIAAGAIPKDVEQTIQKAGRSGIGFGTPLLNRGIKHDFAPACAEIFRYFHKMGKTNCKLMSTEHNHVRINGLIQAYPELSLQQIMEKHFFQLPSYSTTNADDLAQIGYTATGKLLDQSPSVQAIFYHSDYLAVGGIQYLCDHGIMPGEDILLAGVNNIHAIRNHICPVSSISHNIPESVKIIINHLDDDEEFCKIIVPQPVFRTKFPCCRI